MQRILLLLTLLTLLTSPTLALAPPREPLALWQIYTTLLRECRYVDLTHAFTPDIPVWPGFGTAQFLPARAGAAVPGFAAGGQEFTYAQHGFAATAYVLPTDQYGTQLDPPAHWDEFGATISDLPPTMAVRPLVVIDIHRQVLQDSGYHCTVADIREWERRHGTIPAGAVVMIRSDWHKRWNETERFARSPFPGITLAALQFLHLDRQILFHGHEPLDTDDTPKREGEYWLLHHQYCQAEGVANLDRVPEAGALITIGFAKPKGGTGGYARYVAICPPDWPYGERIVDASGAPLPRQEYPLRRDDDGVLGPTRP